MPYFLTLVEPNDVALIIGALLILVASALTARALRRRASAQDNQWLYLLVRYLSGPVEILLVLGVFYTFLKYLPYQWTQVALASSALTIALILAVAWLAIRGIKFGAELILRSHDVGKRDNLNARMIHTQIRVLQRLLSAIVIIVALASSLMVFDQIRALGVSLLASAGVAGIVLGLAAQKTLGNFFTGLQIALTQPIRIEDAVVVEGEWGWIEEINLTYVVVKIWDQRRLILPISYFVEKPFQNWTRRTADILGAVILYLDYTIPLEDVREELSRILEGCEWWDGRVQSVQVTDTTEKSMVVRVLVSAGDSPSAWNLRCHVREKMIAFIQQKYPEHLPRFRAEIPGNIGNTNGPASKEAEGKAA